MSGLLLLTAIVMTAWRYYFLLPLYRLQQAEAEIRQLNARLEERVQERTVQLIPNLTHCKLHLAGSKSS